MTVVQNTIATGLSLPQAKRQEATVTSPKRLARIAGLLYLINGIFGGFAFAYVIGKVYVAGDAAITAANVATNSGLVRVGVVADLFQATEWVFLAISLWLLLRHVNTNAASAMVILVAVGAGITCLNGVFQFEAVRVATDGFYVALGAASSSALVLLLLDMHHYGFLIAQIFFGLWLVPLGYLVYTSGMFPRALGGALIVGGACYLVGLLAVFLVPDVGETINVFVTIPSAIAEISMVLYLLVKGVRSTPIDAIDRGQMLTASVSAAA